MPAPRKGALRIAILGLLLALGVAACASGPFAFRRKATPAEAIASCIESTPSERVMYADAFSACMEGHGWVHTTDPS